MFFHLKKTFFWMKKHIVLLKRNIVEVLSFFGKWIKTTLFEAILNGLFLNKTNDVMIDAINK